MRPIRRTWKMVLVLLLVETLVPIAAMGIEMVREGSIDQMKSIGNNSKTIVILGASYARGFSSEKPLAGYQVINTGVGGQQSFEMLSRFETDVLAVKPDAVVIWGFINDIFRSDRGLIEQTLKQTRENLAAMTKKAKDAGVTPILATEVTIRARDSWQETIAGLVGWLLGKTSYHEYINGHVMQVNRWMREFAACEGVLVLDFEVALSDKSGTRKREFAQPDGSHITFQGYEALWKLAEGRIRSEASHR